MAIKGPNNSMMKRLLVLLCCVGVCCFAAVAVRLFYMQVIDYEFYQAEAVNQQTRDVVVPAARGTIYDRNYKELAVSATTESVIVNPSTIEEGTEERVAQVLSELLEVEYETVLEKTQKDSQYELIKSRVEKETTDQIREIMTEENLSGIEMTDDSKRYYPYNNFASHVIGFTGTDGYGLTGIEVMYEDVLAGTPGKIVTARNAANTDMPFQYEQYIEAEDGLSVVLTIDEVIQHFLEKHLESALEEYKAAKGVAGIVMDVNTGEILAMATKPDFDLNEPFTLSEFYQPDTTGMTEEEAQEANSNALEQMWRNKAVSDTFEPGSTFKLFTVAVAYEEGVVKESDHFNCPGYRMVAGERIRCWKTVGHGGQTLLETLKNSCNPAMMEIAARTGAETYLEYYDAFGLRERTGIDLPGEAVGIFFNEGDFNEVQLATTAFGQGPTITPLQLITMVSAIANGGNLVQPHLVREYLDSDGNVVETIEGEVVRQVISEETSAFMREGMELVVSEGTGKNAYVAGYRVGGKTGTSEKLPRGNGKYVGSFVGVAPMDDPQIAVFVMIDEYENTALGGGTTAAPTVGNIMADILPYLGVEPQYTAEELASRDISVPTLVGATRETAEQQLKNQNISYRLVGDGDTVTDQVPAGGAVVPASAQIILYLGEEKPDTQVTVPDLTGMTAEQATSTLAQYNLYLKMTGVSSAATTGTTVAQSQSPAAGSSVAMGTVVTVKFTDSNDVGD